MPEEWGDQYLVYARVNLKTRDMYVGETGNWEQRFEQHFMRTRSHARGASNPCTGCAEHTRYKKHRAAAPTQWIMLPFAFCESKGAALRVETWARRRWRPNMNQTGVPFWMQRAMYHLEATQRPAPRAEETVDARVWTRARQSFGQHEPAARAHALLRVWD